MPIPEKSKFELLKVTEKQRQISECNRVIQNPFTIPQDKSFYSGKILVLSCKSKIEYNKLKKQAEEMIKSEDIMDRAKGFGILHDYPEFMESVELLTYRLK